jgi:aryl sulfotransferase
MPSLIRPPLREVRSRVFDSARWAGYRPRSDDIVIGTYSKCGTTWMQRIVSMLVFRSAAPMPIWDVSPWPDMRIFGPVEETLAQAEAQTHRRFFKTHLPFDALPVYEGMRFIHVGRDGRDAAMSLHNHLVHARPDMIGLMQAISREDPKFGDEVPPFAEDPAEFFHEWVSGDGSGQGDEGASFFHVENSYWAARRDANLLLVHYNDLQADLGAEMRRVADFLEIAIDEALWPALVEAAGFETMKAQGDALIPQAQMLWEGGAGRFLHKGTNGRWREVVLPEDLERYDARVTAEFTPNLARWVEHGRRIAGDPRELPD